MILLVDFVNVTRAKEELLVAKQQHGDHVRQISEDHVSHQLQIRSLIESCEQLRKQLAARQQEIEKYVKCQTGTGSEQLILHDDCPELMFSGFCQDIVIIVQTK